MKTLLIIGNGISGLSAALAAAEKGIHCTVVGAQPSERSQSVMAAGGINAVNAVNAEDSIACHIQDTLKGGCFMEDERAIKGLCSSAPDIIKYLSDAGVVFSLDEEGRPDRRAFGGQSFPRTAFSGTSTGKQIVTALVRKVRRYECEGLITRRNGLTFGEALIEDGICYGALFYEGKYRHLEAIFADAVIVAAGGQNQLFGKTTGSTICDGYTAATLMSQGVTLRNLEFVQYHPTTIETPTKRMLISEAARGEGGRLYYLDGDKRVYFMEEKYGPKGNLMPRDIVSREVHSAPSQVYLDVAFLGKEKILSRMREIYDLCHEYTGLDVTEESIPVSPSVHFFMGGIAVDLHHRTNIERLYAVGECASIYHGANRLGGNSLLAAMYSGRVAARDAAERLAEVHAVSFGSQIEEREKKLQEHLQVKSLFPVVYLRNMLAEAMQESMGIIRTEEGLKKGLD
ncbi:MAG: FAD-binding protein, partial [Parasporobacterium sp.]|nr:FAD-binding protein [Parasporobacterium sp.]